jgi:transcriptional regulator with XRE-family HTH domain
MSGGQSSTFGGMLASLLKKREWTLREFARRTGNTHAWIGRVARGEAAPSEANLQKWSATLGLQGEGLRLFLESGVAARTSPRLRKLLNAARSAGELPKTSRRHDSL